MSLALWQQRFAEAGERYVFGEAPNLFLKGCADRLPDAAHVLSVADGEGRNSVWLASLGHRVDAIEFSPAAIDKARKLAARAGVGVGFEQADVFEWDWPKGVFDAVVAIFIQFASPSQRKVLFHKMGQSLRPGGLLLLHGYTPQQIEFGTGGPSVVENLYTEQMLRESFADLEILRLVSYEREIHEGQAHDGMSALIDLVARKPR